MEKAVERISVAAHYFSIAFRQVFPEIKAEHASYRLRAKSNIMFFSGTGEAFRKLPGLGSKFFIKVWRLHQLQCGKPGGDRDRIAREGACLIYRSHWGQALHNVSSAAECRHRHAAPDHFTQ